VTLVDVPSPGAREVTVWTLEQTAASDLVPARQPDIPVDLVPVGRPAPELSRFLYTAVGGDWYWVDRLAWSYDQWSEWAQAPGRVLLLAQVEGAPAGYAELDPVGSSIELAYFGLLPAYTGHGIGGWLLAEATARAWAVPGAERVWVHTCSLDSPAALRNYQRRGFRVSGTHVELRDVSGPPPGPWPGARTGQAG
jgi:GNAT superfamily N-acetyltransferase